MTARRLLLITLTALFCSPLPAQTGAEPAAAKPAPEHAGPVVYKCTNADGSVVFSESPCSTDPAKVVTIDTSPAMRTGSGGHQGEIAASVADSDCREQAFKSTHADEAQIAESNRHIADYERRRTELQAPSADAAAPASDSAAAAPAAAATPENEQALAQLEASIAAEREFQSKAMAGDEAAYQAALKRCDEELKRATPPPAPAKPAPAPAAGDARQP